MAAIVVGDVWLSNKIVPTGTDDPPVKLDLQIKEFSCYSLFKKI